MSTYFDKVTVLGADNALEASEAARKRSDALIVMKGYVGGVLGAIVLGYAGQAIFSQHKFLGAIGGGVTGWCLGAAVAPTIGAK